MIKRKTDNSHIWFNRPSIGYEEKREVLDTLNSGWISTGKKVEQFEKDFLDYQELPNKYAQATSSCTAAMHISLILEGIGPGDEVLVPAITFPATANVVEHVGAKPIFVDVEESTLNIDITEAEDKITKNTRAIMAVSLYGQPCDLKGLKLCTDLNKDNKIVIIQDNAHAIESRLYGKTLPNFSEYSTYSFYATKNMTTAEGGMLILDDEKKAARAEMLCLHGLSKDAWKRYQATGYQLWDLEFPGYKYNMTDIQASLGIWQLKRLEENWLKRKNIVDKYRKELKGLRGITLLTEKPNIRDAYHLFPIIFNDDIGKTQEEIIREIERHGVGIGVHFRCLPLTKYYKNKYKYTKDMFPVASKMTEKIVSIPLYPGLSDEDVRHIVHTIKGVVS